MEPLFRQRSSSIPSISDRRQRRKKSRSSNRRLRHRPGPCAEWPDAKASTFSVSPLPHQPDLRPQSSFTWEELPTPPTPPSSRTIPSACSARARTYRSLIARCVAFPVPGGRLRTPVLFAQRVHFSRTPDGSLTLSAPPPLPRLLVSFLPPSSFAIPRSARGPVVCDVMGQRHGHHSPLRPALRLASIFPLIAS